MDFIPIKRAFKFILPVTLAMQSLTAQNYKKIHQEAIVTDSHNDILSRIIELGEETYHFNADLSGITHTDLHRLKKGGVDVQVFSIWCNGEEPEPYALANHQIDLLYLWLERNPNEMMLVTNRRELEEALKSGKLGAMIGVEGGHMIENSLEKLEELYKRGARYLTLTWNNNNDWATSAEYESGSQIENGKPVIPERKGLTDFGREVVRHMNALGMMVDLSHPGEQTFWDVMQITTKPVLVSHSNAYAMAPFYRNLKDDQLLAVGKNGGVIDVNFYAPFLRAELMPQIKALQKVVRGEIAQLQEGGLSLEKAEKRAYKKYRKQIDALKPEFSVVFDHLEYIIDLVGVDHVGLGADYDGFDITSPKKLEDVSKYPLITQELLKRGYSKEAVFKILGGNFLRVFKANLVE